MRIENEDMRRIGLAVILAGLMVVIIGLGKYFEDSLRIATLTQNSMLDFKEYNVSDEGISYKLPENWLTSESKEEDEKCIYINEFVSTDANIYGYIQVVRDERDFKETINTFKEEIEGMGIKKIHSEEININDVVAEMVEYTFNFSENKVKNTYEYYIPYEDYVIKVSFTINDEKAKENTKVVFENIVKTFSFNVEN